MDDTLELTTEQKAARIAALRALLETEGWKIIQAEITEDIRITESKLFGDVPLANGETIEGLRRERIDRLELRELPANLIREYGEEDAETPDLDPYKE